MFRNGSCSTRCVMYELAVGFHPFAAGKIDLYSLGEAICTARYPALQGQWSKECVASDIWERKCVVPWLILASFLSPSVLRSVEHEVGLAREEQLVQFVFCSRMTGLQRGIFAFDGLFDGHPKTPFMCPPLLRGLPILIGVDPDREPGSAVQ
eukprot:3356377-Amphidinium_carterae.1